MNIKKYAQIIVKYELKEIDGKKFIEEILKEFYNNDNPYDYIGDE